MQPISFKRHRFPSAVILHAIWLYTRFTLSFRDEEELLAERGASTPRSRRSARAARAARRPLHKPRNKQGFARRSG